MLMMLALGWRWLKRWPAGAHDAAPGLALAEMLAR